MGFEQNLTVFAVVAVTLMVLWYVDKEIKILRNDVNTMKDGLNMNVQMLHKLKAAYQSIPAVIAGGHMMKPPDLKRDISPKEVSEENNETIEKSGDEVCVIDNSDKLHTIPENEEPIAANEVPVVKEEQRTVKKGGRRKIVNTQA